LLFTPSGSGVAPENTTLLLINLFPKVKKPKLPSGKIALFVFVSVAVTLFALKFDRSEKTAKPSLRPLAVEEKETVLFTLLKVGTQVPESRLIVEGLTRRLVEQENSTAVDPLLPPEKLVLSRDNLLTFSPAFFKVDPVKQALSLTTAVGIKIALPSGNAELAIRPQGD
jgi:hypothetical protein